VITQKIKIKEYTSASVVGKSTRPSPKKLVESSNTHSDLNINFLKLSSAMVKANISEIVSIKEQVFDAFLSGLGLLGLISYSQHNIKLKSGFRKKYRDFSRTGRVGELSQAINYIFAQEKLGFKFVLDFDTFLNNTRIAPLSTGQAPDYVLLGKANKNLALLESKGSSQKSCLTKAELRAKLQGAMDNQCGSGHKHLTANSTFNVSNSYASVVELAESSEARDSTIHFADPEYDEFEERDYSTIIRKFYSRWLSFLGVDGAIDIFNESGEFTFPRQQFGLIKKNGSDYYVQKSTYSYKYLNVPIKFGVSKDIVDLIEKNDYQSIYLLEHNVISDGNVEFFLDGTLALLDEK